MPGYNFNGKYYTNVYDREYYSGAQALLYIGDVFIDETVSYEYSVTENRMPIRGYASRRFDAVTMGTVEVRGQFTINYKESGYLWAILRRYNSRRGKMDQGPLQKTRARTAHDVLRANFERLSQRAQGGRGASNKDLTEFAFSIAGMLTQGNKELGGKPFDSTAENIFEEYENMLWGSRPQNGHAGYIDYSQQGNPMDVDYRKETDPHWQGFDIWIVHGDYTGSDLKNHTVRKLVNVHLLGSTQAADPSGQPILETYTFIAEDRV